MGARVWVGDATMDSRSGEAPDISGLVWEGHRHEQREGSNRKRNRKKADRKFAVFKVCCRMLQARILLCSAKAGILISNLTSSSLQLRASQSPKLDFKEPIYPCPGYGRYTGT